MNFLAKYSTLLTGTFLFLVFSIYFQSINDLVFHVTPISVSSYHYINYLSAICGPICFAVLAEIVGRKLSLIVWTGAFIALVIITVYFTYLLGFILWSINGGALVLLPIYISEISEKSSRGGYVTLVYLASNLGTLIINLFEERIFWWNISLVVILVLCLLLLVGFCFLGQETPYYLVKKNKRNSAKLALEKIRNTPVRKLDQELEEIARNSDDPDIQKRFLQTCGTNASLKAIISVGGLMFLSSEIGYFSPLQPIETVLHEQYRGWGYNIILHISYNIAGSCSILGLLLCSLLVDKYGRKKCLFISWLGLFYSMSVIATNIVYKEYFALNRNKTFMLDYLSGGASVTYFIFFSLGLGPVPFIMLGEMFPEKWKALYVAGIVSFQVVQQFVNDVLQKYVGISRELFMLKAIFAILLLVPYVRFYVLETAGLTLQKIQSTLRNSRPRITNEVINLETIRATNQEGNTETELN